jgi:hypothetical protein
MLSDYFTEPFSHSSNNLECLGISCQQRRRRTMEGVWRQTRKLSYWTSDDTRNAICTTLASAGIGFLILSRDRDYHVIIKVSTPKKSRPLSYGEISALNRAFRRTGASLKAAPIRTITVRKARLQVGLSWRVICPPQRQDSSALPRERHP